MSSAQVHKLLKTIVILKNLTTCAVESNLFGIPLTIISPTCLSPVDVDTHCAFANYSVDVKEQCTVTVVVPIDTDVTTLRKSRIITMFAQFVSIDVLSMSNNRYYLMYCF